VATATSIADTTAMTIIRRLFHSMRSNINYPGSCNSFPSRNGRGRSLKMLTLTVCEGG